MPLEHKELTVQAQAVVELGVMEEIHLMELEGGMEL
jgi:hypothetical protein